MEIYLGSSEQCNPESTFGVTGHPVQETLEAGGLDVEDRPSVADLPLLDVVVERVDGVRQAVDEVHRLVVRTPGKTVRQAHLNSKQTGLEMSCRTNNAVPVFT